MCSRYGWRTGAVGLAAVGAIMATGAVAMIASNTVTANKAGSGAGIISGYTISGIKHALDSTDATKFASVTFDVEGSDVSSTTGARREREARHVVAKSCGTRTYSAGGVSERGLIKKRGGWGGGGGRRSRAR